MGMKYCREFGGNTDFCRNFRGKIHISGRNSITFPTFSLQKWEPNEPGKEYFVSL
jgi:hypothetical protein